MSEEKSVLRISHELNIKYYQVYRIIKNEKIKIRSNKFNSLKHTCNDSFFWNINTVEKAYWLGFIFADGHVSISNNCYRLHLTQTLEDKDVLEMFIQDIQFSGEIKIYPGQGSSKDYGRVSITSEKLVKDLISQGCVERKSLILLPPKINEKDDSLVRAFIRGYFDGDGSITQNKSKQSNFKICGTSELLTWINRQLSRLSSSYVYDGKLYKKRNDNKNNYYISYGGNQKTLDAMNILYSDLDKNSPKLQRKYNKYLELKSKVSQSS